MNLLKTPLDRATVFCTLYASEGAPIGFIWWALPTLMRERGGEVGRITAVLAAVTAIWALKFLWAPIVDVVRGPRWGFRSWILVAQSVMGLTLLPLAWLDPVADMPLVVSLLILHALCATVQDVAIDALAINVVPPDELGRINGFMAAGKYIGRGLFGGVSLIVAAALGWQWIIFGMIGFIWAILVLVWALPATVGQVEFRVDAGQAGAGVSRFFRSLRNALRGKIAWLAIGIALLSGAGFEAVGALIGTYLPDRGMSIEDIGWFRSFVVLAAMILGGLLGGWFTDRLGALRATVGFLLTLFGCNLLLGLADHRDAAILWLLIIIAFMYFCYGMFISASYALFMSVTDRRLAGTQFSVFMAATNGCEVWAGWTGGQIVEHGGYVPAFVLMSAASLFALPLLKSLRRDFPNSIRATST